MGDFYQNGLITTLHDLKKRSLEDMEAELVEFSKVRPMSLILPSLFSELEGPALHNILLELNKVPYLTQIIVGLDQANEEQFKYAKEFFNSRLTNHDVTILWNDGPRLRDIDHQIDNYKLAPSEAGKGRNLWYCFGYFIASGKGEAVALHDCDILTYDRSLLARLMYPVANPNFNYRFCKGYYFRANEEKLNGRVTRLLVTPLLRALKLIFGPVVFLEYLDSFRYPLAGEFSMRADVVKTMRISSDWSIEIGVLSEVHRNNSTNRICQVEIADAYDHKHQDLKTDSERNGGLSRMSTEITKAIFRKLATNGQVFTKETFRTIKATYYRIALDFVEQYYCDSVINGFSHDRHTEEKAVELFAQNIMHAGTQFLENSMETSLIPSWKRVRSAITQYDIFDRFLEAVDLDNK